MAGNFFTKPKGLHPTPSACFAPPKCKPPGFITIYLDLNPREVFRDSPLGITAYVDHPNYEMGQPLTAHWTDPGFTFSAPPDLFNKQPLPWGRFAGNTAGTFELKLEVIFPNGSTIEKSAFWTILTVPPPIP